MDTESAMCRASRLLLDGVLYFPQHYEDSPVPEKLSGTHPELFQDHPPS